MKVVKKMVNSKFRFNYYSKNQTKIINKKKIISKTKKSLFIANDILKQQ